MDLVPLKACSGEGFWFSGYAVAKYSNFKAGKGLRNLCH